MENEETRFHDRRREVSEGEDAVPQGRFPGQDSRESRQVMGMREFAQSRQEGECDEMTTSQKINSACMLDRDCLWSTSEKY